MCNQKLLAHQTKALYLPSSVFLVLAHSCFASCACMSISLEGIGGMRDTSATRRWHSANTSTGITSRTPAASPQQAATAGRTTRRRKSKIISRGRNEDHARLLCGAAIRSSRVNLRTEAEEQISTDHGRLQVGAKWIGRRRILRRVGRIREDRIITRNRVFRWREGAIPSIPVS